MANSLFQVWERERKAGRTSATWLAFAAQHDDDDEDEDDETADVAPDDDEPKKPLARKKRAKSKKAKSTPIVGVALHGLSVRDHVVVPLARLSDADKIARLTGFQSAEHLEQEHARAMRLVPRSPIPSRLKTELQRAYEASGMSEAAALQASLWAPGELEARRDSAKRRALQGPPRALPHSIFRPRDGAA
jgi:hypothetical protein